ncbi:MAG: TatD family hydrolase [Rhabdochlamydiaceae bacterium]|nr:TatD family hydrolase [Candidatus Amphrikana amoebophyrae]
MFIDSHAHLTCDELYFNLEAILQRASEAGIQKVINICTDKVTLERGIIAKKRFPMLYNVGSTTPHDVEKLGESDFPLFEESARNGDLVAIGETGLDYYYDHSPKEKQHQYLIRYFHLAKELNLPVVIHCRDAFDDLFKIADKEYGSTQLLLHCFTGNVNEAKEVLDRGWTISFSGIVTFKRSDELREAAKITPIERMVVETDSPYLAPQSKRGKQCEPAFARETLQLLADLKGETFESMAKCTRNNTIEFFNL